DAGNPGGCTDGQGHLLRKDQRGMPRPDHEDTSGCDMGAYESQSDDSNVNVLYSGYCEATDTSGSWLTNGECVSHNLVGFCYIQGSTNCPNGRRVRQLSATSCGGLGSAFIDLARPCSF